MIAIIVVKFRITSKLINLIPLKIVLIISIISKNSKKKYSNLVLKNKVKIFNQKKLIFHHKKNKKVCMINNVLQIGIIRMLINFNN